jgi:NAD+ synthase (glutamine-hydrolysing)
LAGFLAPIADLWKTQVYAMSKYFNENIDNVIPEEAFTVMPSAELSVTQDVDQGKGDPIIYKYHDKLFASWVEKWNRATPEDILEWFMKKDQTLFMETGIDLWEIASIFKTKEDFIADMERWWNLYNGLSVVKRIYAPGIISVSRRAFGYDHRECVNVKPHYSARYYQLKEQIVKGE